MYNWAPCSFATETELWTNPNKKWSQAQRVLGYSENVGAKETPGAPWSKRSPTAHQWPGSSSFCRPEGSEGPSEWRQEVSVKDEHSCHGSGVDLRTRLNHLRK